MKSMNYNSNLFMNKRDSKFLLFLFWKSMFKSSMSLVSIYFYFKIKCKCRTSLVVQWLRICLPMEGTNVQSLVWEDPTCRRATKPMRHNYWNRSLEPMSFNYWAHASQLLKQVHSGAHMLQLLRPVCLEPVLCKKRSHCNEKPMHNNEE